MQKADGFHVVGDVVDGAENYLFSVWDPIDRVYPFKEWSTDPFMFSVVPESILIDGRTYTFILEAYRWFSNGPLDPTGASYFRSVFKELVSVSYFKNTYKVGGNVSGLSGSGLVLQNNTDDDLVINAAGGFTFTTPLEGGSSYTVTVLTQPTSPNQTCSVTSGSGAIAGADVVDVSVTCVTKPDNMFTNSFEGGTLGKTGKR